MNGGNRLRAVALIVALAFTAAACGSGDDDLTGPVDGLPEEAAASPSADEDDDGSTTSATTSPASTTTEATDTTPPDDSEGSSITIVRFENDEHLEATIDAELVEQKVVEAVKADEANWLSCVMAPEDCDFDRDVLPMVTLTRETFLRGIFGQYLDTEGARYRPGPTVVYEVIDVQITTDTPVFGIVEVCKIDSGVVFIPASDDKPEEVLDDEVVGVIYEYRVQQDEGGILRITSRTDGGTVEGDGLCDEYLQ